jgi:mRNA-degrading endonuclease toxin of MazEF toxin-antitoxin module
VLLNQIRSIDKIRLTKKIGEVDAVQWHSILLEMLG